MPCWTHEAASKLSRPDRKEAASWQLNGSFLGGFFAERSSTQSGKGGIKAGDKQALEVERIAEAFCSVND